MTHSSGGEETFQITVMLRAWKNVNFPGSLSKFPVGHHLKTIGPLWRHKRNLFSWKRCSQESNCHCIHIDQLGLIQPTNISPHSTCKQLHRRSVPRYRWVREKTRYRRSANRPATSLGH